MRVGWGRISRYRELYTPLYLGRVWWWVYQPLPSRPASTQHLRSKGGRLWINILIIFLSVWKKNRIGNLFFTIYSRVTDIIWFIVMFCLAFDTIRGNWYLFLGHSFSQLRGKCLGLFQCTNSRVKSLFTRYQKHKAMYNWSPCIRSGSGLGDKILQFLFLKTTNSLQNSTESWGQQSNPRSKLQDLRRLKGEIKIIFITWH